MPTADRTMSDWTRRCLSGAFVHYHGKLWVIDCTDVDGNVTLRPCSNPYGVGLEVVPFRWVTDVSCAGSYVSVEEWLALH